MTNAAGAPSLGRRVGYALSELNGFLADGDKEHLRRVDAMIGPIITPGCRVKVNAPHPHQWPDRAWHGKEGVANEHIGFVWLVQMKCGTWTSISSELLVPLPATE